MSHLAARLLLLLAAGVLANMVSILAAEQYLMVRAANQSGFNFNSEPFQPLHDCLCDGKNTRCEFILAPHSSGKEIKGPNIDSQCSLSKAFYKCNSKIVSVVLNITCIRIPTPPYMYPNCHPLCFTNTTPCDVNAVIKENGDFTVEINDGNVKLVNDCPNTGALMSHNESSWKTPRLHVVILLQLVYVLFSMSLRA